MFVLRQNDLQVDIRASIYRPSHTRVHFSMRAFVHIHETCQGHVHVMHSCLENITSNQV